MNSDIYIVSAGILSGIALSYFVLLYTKKPSKVRKHVEVLCFRYSAISCVPHFYGNGQCTDEKYCAGKHLKRLIELLEGAQSSVHICMALFSNKLLLETVLNVTQKGVTVKVIIGFKRDNGFVQLLRKAGAEVFTSKSDDSFMHNKFIVIDEKIAITGSVNWTDCSIFSNWEILVILHMKQIAIEYEEIFKAIWHDLENM